MKHSAAVNASVLKQQHLSSIHVAYFIRLILACMAVSMASPVPAQQASLQGLGFLAGGKPESHAFGVSANGKVVVGESSSPDGIIAFRWTAEEGMQSLGQINNGSFVRHAHAASGDGSVIVGWADGNDAFDGDRAFRWTAAKGIQILGHLGGHLCRFSSRAFATSSNGQIVVGSACICVYGADGIRYSRLQAFKWTVGGPMQELGSAFEFDSWSKATGVSDDGSLVVGYSQPPHQDKMAACLWQPRSGFELFRTPPCTTRTLQPRDLPPGVLSQSQFHAVSPDGSIAVGEECGEAFLLRFTANKTDTTGRDDEAGRVRLLGQLPNGMPTAAMATSADGKVIVGYGGAPDNTTEAIIWDAKHGFRTLASVLIQEGCELKGWKLVAASSISADGSVIVGQGNNPRGEKEAWIAHLPSKP